MKSKDILKQLLPGVVVGFILGFVLTSLVGVNETDPIPNYIGGAIGCLLPTLLNGVIVLKGTAKHLDRKLSIRQALVRMLPYALAAILIGLFVVIVVVEQLLGYNTCELSVFATATYIAALGVVVSTLFAYIALKRYESQVKYTRRD